LRAVVKILPSIAFICCVATPAAAITCTISQSSIAFGNVDVLPGAAIDTTGTITLSCSGAPASTALRFCTNIEGGTDALGSQRRMASGTDRLNFDVYKDAGRATLWGSWFSGFDTGGSQNDITSDGAGNVSATLTVYARLFSSQTTAVPGSYTETYTGGGSQGTALHYGSTAGGASCQTGGSLAFAGTWTVTATVNASCNVSATNLNFGSFASLGANVDATATVTPQCSNTTPYNIGLNAGNGTGATVATRKMTSGANTIDYSLYTDSGRTTVWGNTIGTNTVSGTGTGSTQSLTVYGRIPSQTTQPPNTYTDTIVVTVTF